MPTPPFSARGHLERLGIDHAALSQADVMTMSYTLHGWQVLPGTAADASPIVARVWLLAALNTRGRYVAPCRPGHPADVEDGRGPIDSVVLMAVIQRHFLTRREPAWDDDALAGQLGLDADDIQRAQRALDLAARLPLRTPRRPPLGEHWWQADADARHPTRDRA
jgi:hypothetical protein